MADGEVRRLFAGIALDDLTRAACAAAGAQLQRTGLAARYEAPEKLHLTLAFLGNVSQLQYQAVVGALERAASRSASLTVTLDKVAAFPHERKPHVVFIGAREQGAAFRALVQNVRELYCELGFPLRGDPVAHVTIARVKDPRRPLPTVEFLPIALRVDSLTLFESIFDPAEKTTRYEVRRRVILSGGP